MTASLTIKLSDEVLDALRASSTITIELTSPGEGGGGGPREGSLPARILAWAAERGKPFRTADVEGRLGVSRAHASLLLSRLAQSRHAIRRLRRGVYEYAGSSRAPTRRRKTVKKRK